jgi:hypothetical protein
MAMPETDFDNDAIARRLKVIRYYKTGDNQSEFARQLDITQPRWNNFERGYPINLRICALLMAAIDGMSIDWIVSGKTHNLPSGLAKKLSEIERKKFQPRKR